MRKICLDKSIYLTRAIMNKKIQVPSFVNLIRDGLGNINSFKFVDSKVEMPIEHLGLGVLAYKGAVDQYIVTRVGIDSNTGEKCEIREFEKLEGTSSHIANFLVSLEPDVLNWYSDDNGALKLISYSGFMPSIDPSNYTKCKLINEEGQDVREQVVTEAYKQAVVGYMLGSMEESDSTQESFEDDMLDFLEEDKCIFNDVMEQLKLQATENLLYLNQTQPKAETNASVIDIIIDNNVSLEQ